MFSDSFIVTMLPKFGQGLSAREILNVNTAP